MKASSFVRTLRRRKSIQAAIPSPTPATGSTNGRPAPPHMSAASARVATAAATTVVNPHTRALLPQTRPCMQSACRKTVQETTPVTANGKIEPVKLELLHVGDLVSRQVTLGADARV